MFVIVGVSKGTQPVKLYIKALVSVEQPADSGLHVKWPL